MQNVIQLENLNQSNDLVKNIDIDKQVDPQLVKNRQAFENVVSNVLDKGGDYVIKALPINDSVKDILIDVKKAFKTKDFKEIIKTAINSSIREGLEMLKIPKNVLSDITKIKDIALKGGLSQALSAGIDIVANKYLKNNLFANVIGDFVKKTKDFLFSNTFKLKIDAGISKILDKTKDFKKLCDNWYESYEKFDVESINTLAKKINRKEKEVVLNEENMKENSTIQNMTKLINTKKEKLSPIQLQICNSL